MGCISSKKAVECTPGYEDPLALASETTFTVNEVEALYELFKKMSCSIIKDGLIDKEEFQLALFRNSDRKNLFADRLFDLFDIKSDGVIDFGEFIRSLSLFHPNAPESEKIAFAFKLYDPRCTGFIERDEPPCQAAEGDGAGTSRRIELLLSDELIEAMVDRTFDQVDAKGDGKIDPDEWREYVKQYPSLIRIMTLPYLKDIAVSFPSFVMCSTQQ